ncbi:flagellar motor switch protein FliM [Nocardioides sp. Soil805]|uniref:flagellar motor switch protein FliM n=1 Tax=Nocardioides sp. Soil805 TaxID=1736416 RepID=UPI000A7FD42D|nr:flagellar motor switch protein FliM [Nocardioides sp. Soil805]
MTLLPPSPGPAYAGARARRRARTGSEPTAYDFRRPIQLSREHSRLLQLTLDGFARQAGTVLTSGLRTVCAARLLGVAQQTYAEYIDSLEATTYLVKFTAEPVPGIGLLDLPLPAVMSAIDHMLGGPGSGEQPQRPLTEIESAVVRGVVTRLLGELEYSLTDIVEVHPELAGVEYSPQLAQAAGAGEVMVVATFDLMVGERSHRVSLCLPFASLHPHLVRAAAPAPVSHREQAQRARAAQLVDRRFQDVPVPAVVRFRPTRLGPDALSSLAVGDVLRLSHPSTAPLEIVVGETTFAHATPGTHGARLAALVVGSSKENA